MAIIDERNVTEPVYDPVNASVYEDSLKGGEDNRTGPTGPYDPGDGPVLGPQVDYISHVSEPPTPPPGINVPLPDTPTSGGILNINAPPPAGTGGDAAIDEGNLSGVPLGSTDAVTREVQDNELVSKQLEGLLSGDSNYIRNARQRAAELSNRRGQFTSNLFAGAAERAAVEAALPIAQNDALAYRDAAAQNLTVQNQNAIANIQRAAQLDSSLLSSRTSLAMSNLDANTRVSISNADRLANIDMAKLDADTRLKVTEMTNATQLLLQDMQGQLQMELQTRNFDHDASMEAFKQSGRLELANLDIAAREALQAAGFTHDIDMQNLSAEDAMELQTLLNEYDIEKQARDHNFNTRQSHINMAMQAQINYINYLSSFAGTEMDAAAASRLQQQADAQLVATFQMINGLYPNQPPIQVEFGQIGG